MLYPADTERVLSLRVSAASLDCQVSLDGLACNPSLTSAYVVDPSGYGAVAETGRRKHVHSHVCRTDRVLPLLPPGSARLLLVLPRRRLFHCE